MATAAPAAACCSTATHRSVVRSGGPVCGSLADIRQVVIAARQGRAITVGDVAEVRAGERPRFGIVAADDRDSIVEGIVSMTKGGDPAKINAELKRAHRAARRPGCRPA